MIVQRSAQFIAYVAVRMIHLRILDLYILGSSKAVYMFVTGFQTVLYFYSHNQKRQKEHFLSFDGIKPIFLLFMSTNANWKTIGVDIFSFHSFNLQA